MEDEQRCKRRRTASLVGLKGVTSSALSALLQELHEEDFEPLTSRQINAFVHGEFSAVRLDIDLPLQEGGTFKWTIGRLDFVLRAFAENSDAFKQALEDALKVARCCCCYMLFR